MNEKHCSFNPQQRTIVATWIDFKELREKLDFEAVLQHYGVEIKTKGAQHLGFCPLPGHGGNRKSPSFSANLERKIFHCFGCQAAGNVLEFAALMERASLDDGAALRKVALGLQERFCSEPSGAPKSRRREEKTAKLDLGSSPVVNAPLDFELKQLDRSHPYLRKRGFTNDTLDYFGLGYCSRGSLTGRVAIPLHDSGGRLIGYAGRVVDDSLITDDNPRYRLPTKRERDGRVCEFRKTLFLYNGYRVKGRGGLIVVEGFPSVWWLTQHGHTSVVATMGAECSDEQAELMVSMLSSLGYVWVMSDGDKAGEKFAQSILAKISPYRFVRRTVLDKGRQPTDLSADELKSSFRM